MAVGAVMSGVMLGMLPSGGHAMYVGFAVSSRAGSDPPELRSFAASRTMPGRRGHCGGRVFEER